MQDYGFSYLLLYNFSIMSGIRDKSIFGFLPVDRDEVDSPSRMSGELLNDADCILDQLIILPLAKKNQDRDQLEKHEEVWEIEPSWK